MHTPSPIIPGMKRVDLHPKVKRFIDECSKLARHFGKQKVIDSEDGLLQKVRTKFRHLYTYSFLLNLEALQNLNLMFKSEPNTLILQASIALF